MNSILIDTDIFIDHLRGLPPAAGFLGQVLQGKYGAHISVMTEMELLAGTMKSKEERDLVERLIRKFNAVPVSSSIARSAGVLLREYRAHGLAPVDAVIASTALELKALLVTKNSKHFNLVKGLLTLHPYASEN